MSAATVVVYWCPEHMCLCSWSLWFASSKYF